MIYSSPISLQKRKKGTGGREGGRERYIDSFIYF